MHLSTLLLPLVLFLWHASFTHAQLRLGNLTGVLPQCTTQCTDYDVMTTECNNVGIYQITYIYCECSANSLQIVQDCFNCQAVNATQQKTMQGLLDDLVNTCNDKTAAPASTLTVSPLQISPSASASAGAQTGHAASLKQVHIAGFAAVSAVLAGVGFLYFQL
ncbi:unnamed protein product [Mycena citricolor]|uniref:Extracellular membrane protein CFEM domain-containing protein n=1 Tax=Mycena citricolor TaxID=2018698 RepID=A0AAD2HS74_9AGAR|nr:unnamed protein product [Mycena citricolor]